VLEEIAKKKSPKKQNPPNKQQPAKQKPNIHTSNKNSHSLVSKLKSHGLVCLSVWGFVIDT